ncbi:MAG TPA: hypothetical protein DCZ94_21305 [Lentisphaeria bacterium]|nr:MAG: hypothetical protein A2X48_01055 [Lentisphaerae bacterium GWF2_49_21]HBC89483.1 hypothetical protein [Lentisphaeria bacterium]
MKKLFLAVLLVVGFGIVQVNAEEAKPKANPEKAIEGMKKGDKGTITGQITKIEGGKVSIKDAEKEMTVAAKWIGGAKKDGGGYDKDTMAKIEKLKVGDKVKVEWWFNEMPKIVSIEKVE